MNTLALDALGQRLTRVLDTPAAFAILSAHSEADSFTAGACWPLARALASLLGPGAVVRGLRDPEGLVQHVVVRYGGRYFDGNGAFTREEMTRYWWEHERVSAKVDRFSQQDGHRDADYGWDVEEPLRAYLAATLSVELARVQRERLVLQEVA